MRTTTSNRGYNDLRASGSGLRCADCPVAACGGRRAGGQVDVLAFANVHAADKRAQTVAVVAVPSVATGTSGRNLMAIEQDIAKARIDLTHVDARAGWVSAGLCVCVRWSFRRCSPCSVPSRLKRSAERPSRTGGAIRLAARKSRASRVAPSPVLRWSRRGSARPKRDWTG